MQHASPALPGRKTGPKPTDADPLRYSASALELAVEAHEAGDLEDVVVGLLLDLGAPVPGGGQAAIDAAARIKLRAWVCANIQRV